MKAFEINVGGKILDYRIGRDLDLEEVRKFFGKKYTVLEIWQEKRHTVAILEKTGKKLFLKLAPTEGISAVTKIEFNWNEEFNRLAGRNGNFLVPQNIDSGIYKDGLFYIITDYFEGEKYAERPQAISRTENFTSNIEKIIEFSQIIQNLQIRELSEKDYEEYHEWFLEKTKSWYEGIHPKIREEYGVEKLLDIVKNNYRLLKKRARHGDFTPWHMIDINGKIGLIDGEHAMKNSVEYYDLAYLIQRTYSVLENKNFAKKILSLLIEKNYNVDKLRTLLASRAIGGFLDESLKEEPKYSIASDFGKWVKDLI